MSTLSQLITQRAAAGAAYASAVHALKTAYVNLAALDRTIENRNVGGPVPVLTFLRDKSALDDLVRLLQHAEFAPSLKQDWPAQIITASNTQVASFTPG